MITETIAWLSANYLTVLAVVSAVIAGASVALRVISPLTASDWDNRVLSILVKLERLLAKVALDSSAKKEPAPETTEGN